MSKHKFFILMSCLWALAALWGAQQANAQGSAKGGSTAAHQGKILPSERQAAANRAATLASTAATFDLQSVTTSALTPGAIPDYFGTTPNYANSPLPQNDPAATPLNAIISGGGGTGAAALAIITNGVVSSFMVTNGGSGYSVMPAVTITDQAGTGSGATAVASVDSANGVITKITVTSAGSGYVTPLVAITGNGTGAAATAFIDGVGAITSVVVTNGGSGYSGPAITVDPAASGGLGATGTATVDPVSGAITDIAVTDPGSGYFLLHDANGNLTGAMRKFVDPLPILPVAVADTSTYPAGGSGYTSPPAVEILGGGGSGAAATATVAGGIVTGITVTNPGSGYTSVPVVSIKGDGMGAAAMATVSGGAITAINMVGSDYYEIAVVDYTQQMHSDLNPTTLRGYVQLETPVNATTSRHIPLFYRDGTTPIADASGNQYFAYNLPTYLGPAIVAQRNKPVRVLFRNLLGTGAMGDLFLPVDPTIMGAGPGPAGSVTDIAITNGGSGYTSEPTVLIASPGGTGTAATAVARVLNGSVNFIQITNVGSGYTTTPNVTLIGGGGTGATATATAALDPNELYTSNRAVIHLHGGVTPWISDGVTHGWITPAGENTSYPRGVTLYNVPDMPNPGPGATTLYYTNQQSSRLMFYHEHIYGATRLGVYAGEAAPYLVREPVEQDLINAGVIPANEIAMVIQDKTFLPGATQLAAEDPTWPFPLDPAKSDMWFPHVYMPNQNPADPGGVNAMGRWDYGPWFWPPFTGLVNGPVPNPLAGTTPLEGPYNPGTPNPSQVPESFMDTPIITAWPTRFLMCSPRPTGSAS